MQGSEGRYKGCEGCNTCDSRCKGYEGSCKGCKESEGCWKSCDHARGVKAGALADARGARVARHTREHVQVQGVLEQVQQV